AARAILQEIRLADAVAIPPPPAKAAHDLLNVRIRGGYHPALRGRDVVRGIERAGGHRPEPTEWGPLPRGAQRITGILEKDQIAAAAQVHQPVHVRRVPQYMREQDGPGLGRKLGLDLI